MISANAKTVGASLLIVRLVKGIEQRLALGTLDVDKGYGVVYLSMNGLSASRAQVNDAQLVPFDGMYALVDNVLVF